jgi:hypothetical protein
MAGPDDALADCLRPETRRRSPLTVERGAPERMVAGDARAATFAPTRRDAQRLAANVRHVIFVPLKAKPDALTLRLAVCDFA